MVTMGTLLGAFLILIARVVNVSLGTIRTLLSMRGHKGLSTLMGFFESLIFVIAIGYVLKDLNNVWNVGGYCIGFALGIWLGMILEEKMALGFVIVRIASRANGPRLAMALRDAGFGVTEETGQGLGGKVSLLTTVIKRRDISKVMSLVGSVDDSAFVTVEEARQVLRGYRLM
ncbi:MAG: hypothetical protein DRI61_15350 [Chloroflexi bacterium]|nr:MAG: hypothetical protein DRI61_15350 [Chloroflexota bacterium]HDN80382.1 DUF2179 domain-containing protein [Chloroflexota bacterium]